MFFANVITYYLSLYSSFFRGGERLKVEKTKTRNNKEKVHGQNWHFESRANMAQNGEPCFGLLINSRDVSLLESHFQILILFNFSDDTCTGEPIAAHKTRFFQT